MVRVPITKSDDSRRFATRLSLFYAAMFIGFGLHQPFFPIWLKTKGLADAQIGMILAGGQLIRLLATPVVTYLADRAGTLSYAIVICCFATAVAFIGVALADGFTMILIGVILTGLVWSPLVPLTDAYGLAGVARRTLDYGRIRVWGSVAFMAANVAGGVVLTIIAPDWIAWMIWASLVPLAVVSVMLVHDLPDRSVAPSGPGFFNQRFLLIMIAAAFLQGSHAVYYGFASIHWKAIGYSGFTVGTLWAIAVFAEIVMFWVATRFTRDWRPTTFLLIGGAGGLLRWIVMALDPPLWINGPLQLLHAAGFGLVHLGTMSYLAARLPPHQRASGQGTVSVAIGGSMALSTLIAGYLYARVGVGAYVAMAGLCGAGIIVTAVARSMPIPRPAAPVQPQSEGAGG